VTDVDLNALFLWLLCSINESASGGGGAIVSMASISGWVDRRNRPAEFHAPGGAVVVIR